MARNTHVGTNTHQQKLNHTEIFSPSPSNSLQNLSHKFFKIYYLGIITIQKSYQLVTTILPGGGGGGALNFFFGGCVPHRSKNRV